MTKEERDFWRSQMKVSLRPPNEVVIELLDHLDRLEADNRTLREEARREGACGLRLACIHSLRGSTQECHMYLKPVDDILKRQP